MDPIDSREEKTRRMDRRRFMATSAGLAALLPAASRLFGSAESRPSSLVMVRNGSPGDMVRRAVAELGGIGRFVKSGDIVVVKPNMAWDRVPEQAATTNPEVVGAVVRLCIEAGAKRVKVFYFTLNAPRQCYRRTGIQQAAETAGAEVSFINDRRFKSVSIPDGDLIKRWEIYEDALEADRFINVPAAKHHSVPEAGVSLGMKNLMGVIGGQRGQFHRGFAKKIIDLSTRIKPDLVVLDAYRLLTRNGPSGGNLADVALKKTLIAGTDPVAVDSLGATLFNLDPKRLAFLIEAKARGLGENDLARVALKTIEAGA